MFGELPRHPDEIGSESKSDAAIREVGEAAQEAVVSLTRLDIAINELLPYVLSDTDNCDPVLRELISLARKVRRGEIDAF